MAKNIEKPTPDELRDAGLRLMEANGMPCTKEKGQIYTLSNGTTVRLKVHNNHGLLSEVDENGRSKLEGADYILLAFPVKQETRGDVVAYLIPTNEAIEELFKHHKMWVASGAETSDANKMRNIWFNLDGKNTNTKHVLQDYAIIWKDYRLPGTANTEKINEINMPERANTPSTYKPTDLHDAVEKAKSEISKIAGTEKSKVKIYIHFDE